MDIPLLNMSPISCQRTNCKRNGSKLRNMSTLARTTLILFLGCGVVFTHAFNTDTSSPIIRQGPKGSYFGYSLAMHREMGENMLLVGAPRANSSQPGVVAGGALYKCPLTSPPYSDRCQQLVLDATGNEIKNGEEMTNKSGQMFGATVQSGGPDSPVVVCQPLHTWFVYPPSQPNTLRAPVGGCVIARRNFSDLVHFNPCKAKDAGDVRYCQLGLSAAVSDGEVLMGAVGSYKAKGQIYIADFFEGFNHYESQNPEKNLQNSDYKGYAVSFGDFDNDGYNEYVVGTPRAEQNKGTVSVFDGALFRLSKVQGTQMGAYYGHTVAASDFNGDGYDDLVVSAPMFSNLEENVLHYDVGRVYIYENNMDGTFKSPQILTGRWPGGRFGFSLATLGDINQDGFNDLAIGAPHDGESGMGRVYIYHSAGRRGLVLSASQVLDPVVLGLTLPSFGFSLSAAMDMDANQYPDIVVGMYKSSSVAVFRSRPVVDVSAELTVDLEGIRLKKRNHRLSNGVLVSGFNVTLCLSYVGRNVPERLLIDYDLIADTDLPVTQRCYFDLEDEMNIDIIQNQVEIRRGVELCLTHAAYMANSIQDKLTPITIRADYGLAMNSDNATTPRPFELRPILNKKTPSTTSITVPILRNCRNVTCVPDLALAVTQNVESLYVGAKKNVVMVVTITNRGEDAYQSRLRIHVPHELLFARSEQLQKTNDFISSCSSDVQLSLVTCNVGNPLPAGAEVKLRVEFENVNLSGQVDLLTFTLEVRSVEAELESTRRDNRIRIRIPVEVVASMELIGLSNPREVVYDPENYPPDRDIKTQDDIGPEVSHYFSLVNKGPSNIGPTTVSIQWPLFTRQGNIMMLLTRASMNNGRMCTVNAYVNPTNLPIESRIVYEDSNTTPDRSHCENRGNSPTTKVYHVTDRGVVPAEHMECCSLQNCVTITCRLNELLATSSAKAELVISVRSRLLINTLQEGNVTDLTVSSRATAVTKGSYYPIPFQVQPAANYSISTSIIRYREELRLRPRIPFWIYIVAAAAGLLIVILLILVLWKIGFFKRKKITPEQRKKMEHSDTTEGKYETYQYRCRSVAN